MLFAGILQPPFYVYGADLASNYGATGMTIGHEITHAYDQAGSQFDAKGNLADWWTEADSRQVRSADRRRGRAVQRDRGAAGRLRGWDLTISENIADMGGLQIAYDALQLALAESGDPGLIDGLTPDQRFFIAYALSSVEEAREEALRTQLQTDYHAPLRCGRCSPRGTWTPSSRPSPSSPVTRCICHRRSASSSGRQPRLGMAGRGEKSAQRR